MSGPLAQSIVRVQSCNRPAPIESAAPGSCTARQLALTLDRAMELGLWEHADRVARTAARVAQLHAGLTERLARLRLIQGDPETALAIIDSCTGRPASLRMLRNICLIQARRQCESHIDLHRWSAQASCPLRARAMLALLEREIGDLDAAATALVRNLKHMDDPRSLAMLTLMCTEQGRADQSEIWALRLRQAAMDCDTAPFMDIVLRSIGRRGINPEDEPHESHLQALCTELLAREELIGSLVAAQELEPDIASGQLLAEALEQILVDLESPATGYELLARLHMALGDADAALDWARRGLELCPMSAVLVRLTQELCDRAADTQALPRWERAA